MPIEDARQNTNRQHAVPQNIMDVEFKIIGDLTMRQFIYLAFFGGMAYFSFALVGGFLKWPFVFSFLVLGLGLAFVPIQERGLDEWIVNFFKAVYSIQQRVWKKQSFVPSAFSYANIDVVHQEIITLSPTTSRRKLENFLDTQSRKREKQDPLDIKESEYIQKVRDAFYKEQPVVSLQQQPSGVSEETAYESGEQAAPAAHLSEATTEIKETTIEPSAHIEKLTADAPVHQKQKEEIKRTDVGKPKTVQMIKPTPQPKQKRELYDYDPITPDRHSGRKFTNLLPRQGEIVLPVRGELVLPTEEEQKIEEDINEKAQQLKKLLEQLRTDKKQGNAVLEETQTEIARKQETETTSTLNTSFKKEVGNNPPPQRIETQSAPTKAADETNELPEPQQANVVTGIVKDVQGKPLDGVVLIIKNSSNDPVRAIKTNQLGHFLISTPLSSGHYLIEVDKSKKTNLTFDIISFDATGKIIKPLIISGKL